MSTFLEYLFEANAAGSKFEKKTANSINKWLIANKLSSQFKAKRYQNVVESIANRDESYSDIVVENLKSGQKFFIECKEQIKTNIITAQFNINKDFTVSPVKNKDREIIKENDIVNKLKASIEESDEFKKFISFMKEESKILPGISPSKFYFNEEDINEDQLKKLINSYNDLIDSGKCEADNKKFSMKTLRDSTRNMLACGLLWRLSDENNTWDICHISELPYFGDLIRNHYEKQKKIPAKYIQMENDLFIFNKNDNPFNADIDEFPKEIYGRFDLKFTPRFGTGSMYITPRSKILDDIKSHQSFIDKKKWPKVNN